MKKRILSCVMASYLFCGLGLVQAEQTEETQRDRAYHGYGDETQKSQGRKKFKKPRFTDLDLNGDTYITLAEFKEKPIPHGDHETVFGHIDADGNGEITQTEFESHKPPHHKGRRSQKSEKGE